MRDSGKEDGADGDGAVTTEPCEHKDQRPSSDGHLQVCGSCGAIMGALTPVGAQEVRKLQAKWGVR